MTARAARVTSYEKAFSYVGSIAAPLPAPIESTHASCMPNYRRAWIPGGTFFFTVALADRSQSLLVSHIASLRQAFLAVRSRHPFDIRAIVVLPEHLHAIWTLPPGDCDFATRWKLVKERFSRDIRRVHPCHRQIWQKRYWEHAIRDERDFEAHADYVHGNPLKHGLVQDSRQWPYSSIHRRGTGNSACKSTFIASIRE
jgi:putative transposase